jgi:endonuclease YncB( thermonuclease family)
LAVVVVVLIAIAGVALAECVDLNDASHERLTAIVHINDERADQVVAGRPWPGVRALTQVHGIGRGRIRDILEQDLACVGVRVPAGARERIEGVATVLDGDTLEIAGARVRLIGIDAPEGNQLCQVDGHDWPCGQVATAAVYELIGSSPLSCEVYGRDRFRRALAVCYLAGSDLNALIVREGWALAWYPARGAVLGPRYDDEEREAERGSAGIWRGEFVKPWVWRAR